MLPDFVSSCRLSQQCSGKDSPQLHSGSTGSWDRHYHVLSFLINGQLYADYVKLAGMLGFPSYAGSTWQTIVKKLEVHISQLAEWSCTQMREAVKARKDDKKWIASFDGFYLTKGHYSNNCSATLHDYQSGGIAWFYHRTKRGLGHNWEGTSAGAEGDMFRELLGNPYIYIHYYTII